jgi:uncharacterized protein
MHCYLPRQISKNVRIKIRRNPAVAILGPRQCGKTTLAQHLAKEQDNAIYLDLEHPGDRAKLSDPVAFFELHPDELICLDEIQRVPELFPVLRSILDRRDRNGQILILGSASRDLIQQSSETLAGRISYVHLTPFLLSEIAVSGTADLRELWLRGGFPRSVLAENTEASFEWREDFVQTFLERDIGMLGFRLSPVRLGRLWQMCAHIHGSTLNIAKLAGSLGVSSRTVRSYLDLLEQTFMLRLLPPDTPNLKKRLVKSPKVYVRDSGILHALLAIRTHDDLLSHPVLGGSFEGFAMENILAAAQGWEASFYRTAAGAEIDLVLRKGRRCLAFELKASSVPRVSRGLWNALEDVGPDAAYVVAPVEEGYPMKGGVVVVPLSQVLAIFR